MQRTSIYYPTFYRRIPINEPMPTVVQWRTGPDMLDASATIFESSVTIFPAKLEPEGRYAYLSETLKKYTSLPVGHCAFIGTLEKGEELLKERKLDPVGYSRTQFADQGFIKKSVNGEKINNL